MLVERKSLLGVQAAAKGKAPNWCFPLARCFAAILPLFLSVRGCTSPHAVPAYKIRVCLITL
jgi:hypothetical protein